jgi:dihydrofolate reductase
MKNISIIVACDENGGIGFQGKIPWHFPEDFKHFKDTTMGGVCIMGRKTYEEILEMSGGGNKAIQAYEEVEHIGSPVQQPTEIKPLLDGRESFVLSNDANFSPVGAQRAAGLREAIEGLDNTDTCEIFVIGGEKLFIQALAWTDKIHMTIIKKEYDCDRFFPIQTLSKNYKIDLGEELDEMYFVRYIKK